MAFSLGNQLASLRVRIGADLTDFRKGIKELETGFAPIGKRLDKVGASMTKFVTLPILAAGAASIKAAIDFESAFAGVRKTVDATEEEFGVLRKGIIDMSKELPTSANEISGVAEAAGQLGIETRNVLKFSKVMVDLGETTNLSAKEAATAFARFANVTQMAQTDFDRLGSAVVDLGNNFETTESEITHMAQRLAATGTLVGLTQSEILGFATALSSVGIEAEAGGTAFSKLFAEIAGAISRGGSQLEVFAAVAGQSSSEYSKAFKDDAAQATIAFLEGLGKMSRSGGDAFQILDKLEIQEIRMRNAILSTANAGDIVSRAINTSNKAWRENNALVEEANKRYETSAAKLQIAKNEINAAAVEAGSHLVPALVDSAEGVADLASAFADLEPAAQKAIIAMAGVIALAGPLAAAIAVMGAAASGVVASLAVLTGGTIVALDAGKKLGTTFDDMGASATGAAASIGGVSLSHPFLQAAQAAEEANTNVSKLQTTLVGAGFDISGLSLSTQALIKGLKGVGETATTEAPKLAQIAEEAKEVIKFLSQDKFRGLEMQGLDLSGFTNIVHEVDLQTGKITERVERAGGSFEDLGSMLRDTVAPAVGSIGTAFDDVSTSTLRANFAMAELGAHIKANITSIGIGAVDGLSNAIGNVIGGFESLGDAVKRVMRNVIADIGAAIVKALILKGLLTLVGGGGGFFGGIVRDMAGQSGLTTGFAMADFSAPPSLTPPTAISGGGIMKIEVTGRLVGQGSELVAVVDQARINQGRGF